MGGRGGLAPSHSHKVMVAGDGEARCWRVEETSSRTETNRDCFRAAGSDPRPILCCPTCPAPSSSAIHECREEGEEGEEEDEKKEEDEEEERGEKRIGRIKGKGRELIERGKEGRERSKGGNMETW